MKKRVMTSPLAQRQLKALGERLQLARLRRELSLKAVAERAGVSINTVVAAEGGEPGVGFGVIANILHALGLVEDLGSIAKDDILGRKLQDIGMMPRKRAPKKNKLPLTSVNPASSKKNSI